MSKEALSSVSVFRASKMSTIDQIQCLTDPGVTNSTYQLAQCAELLISTQTLASSGFFLLICGTLVFFMQAGFCMVCAGRVRTKNLENSMLKNFLDFCGAALAFFTFGYAFAFGGGNTFIGSTHFFMIGMSIDELVFWFFQMAFAATAATIVAGAVAERCQMIAYFVYSFALTGLVYPVVVRSLWTDHGFLRNLWGDNDGAVDFAGSGVVHLTGGYCALIAAILLGPRKGRFFDIRNGHALDKVRPMPGHSVPLQALGTFTLWFGWYGFNCGSAVTYKTADMFYAASYSVVNTTLSGAMAAVTALFARLIIEERRTGEVTFDVDATLNASLGGSVAITAGAGLLHPYCSVIVGFFAGLIYLTTSELLIRFKIDDVVDAIPVHCFNGLWGMISVGLFAAPDLFEKVYGHSRNVGLFYEWSRGTNSWMLLVSQFVAILFIVTWVTLIMFPFFFVLRYLGYYRSDALEEFVGLDASYHGRSPFEDDPLTQEYYPEYRKRKDSRRRAAGGAAEEDSTEVDLIGNSGTNHPVIEVIENSAINQNSPSPEVVNNKQQPA